MKHILWTVSVNAIHAWGWVFFITYVCGRCQVLQRRESPKENGVLGERLTSIFAATEGLFLWLCRLPTSYTGGVLRLWTAHRNTSSAPPVARHSHKTSFGISCRSAWSAGGIAVGVPGCLQGLYCCPSSTSSLAVPREGRCYIHALYSFTSLYLMRTLDDLLCQFLTQVSSNVYPVIIDAFEEYRLGFTDVM